MKKELRYFKQKKTSLHINFLQKLLILAVFLAFFPFFSAFAQNILDTHFDGDDLNLTIDNYIINASNLIPDSTTLSNTWSKPPATGNYWFGLGLSGSVVILDRKEFNRLRDSSDSFGGQHNDITQFPTAIPFLPGGAIDFRAGEKRLDFGIAGMWFDNNSLAFVSENIGDTFLGTSSNYNLYSIGFDARYLLISEDDSKLFNAVKVNSTLKTFLPAVTLQAGYYFTMMGFGINAGNESVKVELRNDTYFFALQASKKFLFLTPYAGNKLVLSKTDSDYSWHTDRPVLFRGDAYPDGLSYKSGTEEGDLKSYYIIYFGTGVNLLKFEHGLTIGGAYNVNTGHFGVNLSIRLITPNY